MDGMPFNENDENFFEVIILPSVLFVRDSKTELIKFKICLYVFKHNINSIIRICYIFHHRQ